MNPTQASRVPDRSDKLIDALEDQFPGDAGKGGGAEINYTRLIDEDNGGGRVTELTKLLDLPAGVRDLVASRELEMGHARALLALDDVRQLAAAREVVAKGMSVRDTEALVRRLLNPPGRKKKVMDPDIKRLQDQLGERLCATVKIQHGSKGKGTELVVEGDIVMEGAYLGCV